ncbi:MAG: RecQ family ATP-dependent DNA helicase [Bacteroidetes bacterium]|nr:RecQ family ATP-dependent DNA helicase [Bacteroidota bacterium]MBS1541705.1 RecQ family ATP-dependent DNA helicase [Bacteroidota bacterium]
MTPLEILKKYWHYPAFRSPQQEVIDAFLSGKDVVAILPTGAGKSVCFQVASLMKEGVCIVVTPLIALMQDQVQQLKQKDIPALAIFSGMSRSEIDIALDNCVYGKQKFLYVSPERLQTEIFRERFKRMNVNLVAIDEAHCISQWGYDFRPPYLQIASLRELKSDVPFMALTASATKLVREDIVEKLQLRNHSLFQKSFLRENFSLVVRKTEAKEKKLLEILQKVPGSAIVYTRSRKLAQSLSAFLTKNKISAQFYHAGLAADDRLLRQQEWLANTVRVMVATNAFGMGINKADVRTVIHFDLPEDIESYYQEAGRAGRDGKRSYATLLFHEADVHNLSTKTELKEPTLEYLKKVYQALANFFQLAEGSGQGEAFDFDLDQFSKKYTLRQAAVFSALKKMEEFGLLILSEGFHRPSRVHFSIDKNKIYAFQVANALYDPLIKMMLRLYGAELFSEFVEITESKVAKAMKLSMAEVKSELQQLHRLQILSYQPSSDAPYITLLLPRQDANNLPIDHKAWAYRRKLHTDKMQAVINYAEQSHQCRMQFIQQYFGEETFAVCGLCDVCIDKKKKDNSFLMNDYVEQIVQALQHKPLAPDELEATLAPRDKELFVEAVRELVDRGVLRYDEHWLLHKQ